MARQQAENGETKQREARDLEMGVISAIVIALKKLPNHRVRKRVFAYVGERLEDEGRVELAEPPAGA